jgi:hypothetical protein
MGIDPLAEAFRVAIRIRRLGVAFRFPDSGCVLFGE